MAQPVDNAGIRRVVEAIAEDIVTTLQWSHDEAERFVMVNGGVEAYARHAEDLLALAGQVLSNVQDAIKEERIDTTWPVCLQHGTHPLIIDDGLVWRCPNEDEDDPSGFMTRVPFGWLNAVWRDRS